MNDCGNCASLRLTISLLRKQLGMSSGDELIEALGAWNAGRAAGDMIREQNDRIRELESELNASRDAARSA